MSQCLSKIAPVDLSQISIAKSSPMPAVHQASDSTGVMPSSPDLNQSQASGQAKLMIVIAILAAVALGFTGYLGWVALNSSKVAGCGGGSIFDCDDVINSRWSRWLGIPVSFMAFGMYVTTIALIAIGSVKQISARTRKVIWSLVIALGLSAGLAAIWFISLQVFVLKHLCTYCLAAHSCGLIISALILWFRPLGGKTVGYLSLISLLGFGVLAGGQLMVKPVTYKVIEHEVPGGNAVEVEAFEFAPAVDEPATEPTKNKTSAIQNGTSTPVHIASTSATTLRQALLSVVQPGNLICYHVSLVAFQETESTTQQNPAAKAKTTGEKNSDSAKKDAAAQVKERRFVTLAGGTLKLDVAQWPLAGKQDAKYIFVEMFDYTCDHCRRTHAAIAGAKTALSGNMAVLALPIPLNTNCNTAITQTGPRMAEACEISILAVALWRVDPSKLTNFTNI